MTTEPANYEVSETQKLREALAPLAGIDPNGGDFNTRLDLPIFPRDPSGTGPIPPTELHFTTTLRRGRESHILKMADIIRARACFRDPKSSPLELRTALQPLACFPLDPALGDYQAPDEQVLYDFHGVKIHGVKIQIGQIRRARRLLALPGSERSA